jgi:hypothetical protein
MTASSREADPHHSGPDGACEIRLVSQKHQNAVEKLLPRARNFAWKNYAIRTAISDWSPRGRHFPSLPDMSGHQKRVFQQHHQIFGTESQHSVKDILQRFAGPDPVVFWNTSIRVSDTKNRWIVYSHANRSVAGNLSTPHEILEDRWRRSKICHKEM